MKRTCAYILCHGAKSHPLYQPWLDKIQHQVVEEYDESWEPPDDCGIVISHLHYDFPNTAILSRITKQNLIPVLILSDGILEFRNTFQNPKVAAGSIFMPLHGHKLACIGSSQLRIVNGFGNVGKCELVGLPRFDSQIEKPRPSIDTPSNPNLLIATARQPGFNPLQIGQVRRSLSDLKSEIEKLNRPKRRLNVLWRLTGDLESQLGISPKESVSKE